MSERLDFWEQPEEEEVYLLAGWRQWADGGSTSSGLPKYLSRLTNARKIGTMGEDGYYLFQLPVTQDMMRPVIRFKEGYPEALLTHQNDFYYASVGGKGLVFFSGEEPQLNVEGYAQTFLDAATQLGARRVVIFGGVYAEVPYDKDRFVTGIYSVPHLKEEIQDLAINLSDYQGGVSIGSYLCKRASEREIELVGLYAFTPVFHFLRMEEAARVIQIGKDYKAWLDVMRRVAHMLELDLDLDDLETRSATMVRRLEERVEEVDRSHPELGLREHIQRLSEDFNVESFTPLDDVWSDEIRRLGDKFYPEED